MQTRSRAFALALSLCALAPNLASAADPKPAAKAKEPASPLPDPDLRVSIIAPSAQGRWVLRIENAGDKTLRVPADVRVLDISIEVVPEKGPHKVVACPLPAAMRDEKFPNKRAVLLAPGERYFEIFDPRLFCFGKNAALLAGGNYVRARFGWPPPKWGAQAKGPPFAVEDTEYPPTVRSLKDVVVPTDALSYEEPLPEPELAALAGDVADAKPKEAPPPSKDKDAKDTKDTSDAKDVKDTIDAKSKDIEAKDKDAKDSGAKEEKSEPPAVVDENAPRLAIATDPFADASAPEHTSLGVTVSNAGHRPMTVALLTRMLSFEVNGPDGAFHCAAEPSTQAVPHEMFHTMKPGGKTSFNVILREVCPTRTFKRPGLYSVTARVHAGEKGLDQGLDAFTGTAATTSPSLVRLATGPEPFYATEPRVVPAPKADADAAQPTPKAP